ncbi:tRNA (adenosine(37)-N6)-dimethylallyltransferase MiaA [Vulgatibacter sp.]|uniref:tRNA (adenosine(37)-N6)-dimethylallyltransferase MiaA n=1 Tax=Vulgatibacter sp. TaxID=1971226 RepID=UPI00356AB432
MATPWIRRTASASTGPVLPAIVGPTASGKSALALAVAARLPVEIVSCDSQAIYRCLDVGTAKPTAAERALVPHHLVDVADPAEDYSAARFVEEAEVAIAAIRARGRIPLLVGGTGLYLRSLIRGIFEAPPKDEALRRGLEARAAAEGPEALHRALAAVDPETAARLPPADVLRVVRALEVHALTGKALSAHHRDHEAQPPRHRALVLGCSPPRDELYRRVDLRAAQMFEQGLVEEAVRVAADSEARARLERLMGYREALLLADGAISAEEALERTRVEQRRYAKRQLTWFRAMPEVEWLPWPANPDAVAARIAAALAS